MTTSGHRWRHERTSKHAYDLVRSNDHDWNSIGRRRCFRRYKRGEFVYARITRKKLGQARWEWLYGLPGIAGGDTGGLGNHLWRVPYRSQLMITRKMIVVP